MVITKQGFYAIFGFNALDSGEQMKLDMKLSDCFLIFGLTCILMFFILSLISMGPSFRIIHIDAQDPSSWSTSYWVPFWIFLLWIGSCALFLGFLLKLFRIIRKYYEQLNLLICLGLIFTFIFMSLQLNEVYAVIFGGNGFNNNFLIYFLGPSLLFWVMFTSFLALVLPKPFNGFTSRNHKRYHL